MRIVRRAVAVRAHLAQQLQPVFLDAFGHRLTGQAVILMAAHALDDHVPAIEEEAVVGIKADGSEAEAAGRPVDDFAAPRDRRLAEVQHRRLRVPQRGILDAHHLTERPMIARGHGHFALRAGDFLTRHGIENGFDAHRRVLVIVVAQFGIDRHVPAFAAGQLGMHEYAVSLHGDALGDLQPHVAVDARALVPPALVLLRAHIHRHDVLLTEARHVCDVHLEGGIAAGVVLHPAAVDVYRAMHRHALEEQHDALALAGRVQREMLAIPRVVVLEIAQRVVVLLVRGLRNDVIVRQRDLLPIFRRGARAAVGIHAVGIGHSRRADQTPLGLGLSVDQPLAARRFDEYIPLVKQPVLIEIEPFSHESVLPVRL